MMGLAGQAATRWRHSLHRQLDAMAARIAEATALDTVVAEDQAAAEELAETAALEQERAQALGVRGETLIARGHADEAEASGLHEESAAWTARAAKDGREAVAAEGRAAAESAWADQDVAQATAEAALATQDQVAVEADDAAAVTVCQVLPLVDVVCDVVGGVAALGLETQAARSAAESVGEFTAAATAQAEADIAETKAVEWQAAAARDADEAGSLQADAGAVQVKAEDEIVQGKADEAAANEEMAQSALDKEVATEEQTKAVSEQDAAARAWKDATRQGAKACTSAILITVVSLFGILFWVLRIIASTLLPIAKSAVHFTRTQCGCANVAAGTTTVVASPMPRFVLSFSHLFHHGYLFLLFLGIWGDNLLQLRALTSIRAMGGTVLMFVVSLALAQSIVMHTIPKTWLHYGSFRTCLVVAFTEMARRMLVFRPLVAMEILVVWVNLGSAAFEPVLLHVARAWYTWALFAVTVTLHYARVWQVKRDEPTKTCLEESTRLLLACSEDVDKDVHDTEYGSVSKKSNHSNISSDVKETHAASTGDTEHERGFFCSVARDFADLRCHLLFEVLMASIMLALLRLSSPVLFKLWPTSKRIILFMYPQWPGLVTLMGLLGTFVLVVACRL